MYGKISYTWFGSLQKHGKKVGSLDNWLSDASQPFNIYAHHSSVLKVKFTYWLQLLGNACFWFS